MGITKSFSAGLVLTLTAALLLPSSALAVTSPPGPAIGECPAQAEGAADLLPDLKMAKLYGLVIRTTATGHKRLRFGTITWNFGSGPLEVRGDQPTDLVMGRVAQRIYDDQGGCRDVLQPLATMFYAGDGHNHWHVSKYVITQLYRKNGSGGVSRIRKIGFCLVDFHRSATSYPNEPADRVYWSGACGDTESSAVAMGISVGYGDDYSPSIALQWIDITGLPRATYRLCSAVNPAGWWLEKDDHFSNNYFWYDLRLDAANSTFSIVDHGRSACLKETTEL